MIVVFVLLLSVLSTAEPAESVCDDFNIAKNTGIRTNGTAREVHNNTRGLEGCCDACQKAGPVECDAFFTGPQFHTCVLYAAGSVVSTHSSPEHTAAFRGPAPPPSPPKPNPFPGGSLDQELVVLTEDEAAQYNARCLDGSPPAIYYSPARGAENQQNWVLYFKGGGWCFDEQSCVSRSHGTLGTTKSLPHFLNQTWDKSSGPLHPNATLNPTFSNYHRVLLWYCDGASFSGSVDTPVIVGNTTLYFRGHEVLQALMGKLRQSYGLSDAKNVLLTGCSAGGYSTYVHADYVRTLIQSSALTRYKVAGLSGFFLDHLTATGIPAVRQKYDYMYKMQNMSAGVSQACVASKGNCSFPQENYAFIVAPFFVMNSMLDAWQMAFDLEVGCKLGSCNATQIAEINQYQKDFWTTISQYDTFKRHGNGAFLYNCVLHCGEQDYDGFNQISAAKHIGGDQRTLMQQALSTWWDSDNEPAENHVYLEGCALTGPRSCNPTCPSGTLSAPSCFDAEL